MAMNVGSADGEEDAVISAINTTPLVDVMLVMLIIFLITIPVVTTSVPVELPKERVEIRGNQARERHYFPWIRRTTSSGTTRRSRAQRPQVTN